MNDKLFTRVFFFTLIVMMVMAAGLALGPVSSEAELTTDRYETLMGWDASTPNGNATGAGSSFQLYKSNEFPEAFSCYASVTNASGEAVVNTATFRIEGSLDNSIWGILQTTAISASAVAVIKNTASPPARYYRANVTAIQNSTNTYTTVRCLFD